MTTTLAAAITTNPVSSAIPGMGTATSTGAFVQGFYQFALMIGGALAFGAIVYGGVLYAASAGNPSRQSEGREWIKSALLGLLLLAAAYLILYTINPDLVNLNLPTLTPVSVAPMGGGTNAGNPNFGGYGGGSFGGGGASGNWSSDTCASGPCQTLPNCTASSKVNCGGAQGIVDTLTCIQQADPNFTVSEGYPPTVAHTSSGHNNGCSVDTVVPNGCAGVAALQAAAAQCGATSANEYANCGGTIYSTTQGNNVHINAKKGGGGC